MSGDVLVEVHVVHLLLEELRMRQLRREVAVVGQEQHAGGVAVESSHGVYALGACVLHEVHDGLALLRVIACGDVVLGLVEQHVHFLLESHGLVVELHLVRAHHLRAQLGHHIAVDRHHACLYALVGFAS